MPGLTGHVSGGNIPLIIWYASEVLIWHFSQIRGIFKAPNRMQPVLSMLHRCRITSSSIFIGSCSAIPIFPFATKDSFLNSILISSMLTGHFDPAGVQSLLFRTLMSLAPCVRGHKVSKKSTKIYKIGSQSHKPVEKHTSVEGESSVTRKAVKNSFSYAIFVGLFPSYCYCL